MVSPLVMRVFFGPIILINIIIELWLILTSVSGKRAISQLICGQ